MCTIYRWSHPGNVASVRKACACRPACGLWRSGGIYYRVCAMPHVHTHGAEPARESAMSTCLPHPATPSCDVCGLLVYDLYTGARAPRRKVRRAIRFCSQAVVRWRPRATSSRLVLPSWRGSGVTPRSAPMPRSAAMDRLLAEGARPRLGALSEQCGSSLEGGVLGRFAG